LGINIPDIDSRCSAELHECHVQAETEAESIAAEQTQLDADLAEFRGRRPVDVAVGDAEDFRDRQTKILTRELRLRYKIRDLDLAARQELGGKIRAAASSELQAAVKRIEREMVRIGFARPDATSSEREEVACAKFIERHPAVTAARNDVNSLISRSHDRAFAEHNSAEIEKLESRLRQSQARLAQV
jgi:hypothetical protein